MHKNMLLRDSIHIILRYSIFNQQYPRVSKGTYYMNINNELRLVEVHYIIINLLFHKQTSSV